jgi:hypothetical protein
LKSENFILRNWFNLASRIDTLKYSEEDYGDPRMGFQFYDRLTALSRDALLMNVEKILKGCAITRYVGPTREDYPDFKALGAATGLKQQHAHLPVKARIMPPPS